jgi:hypothetical protein
VEASPARRFCFVDKQEEDSSEWEKKRKIKIKRERNGQLDGGDIP